MKQQLLIPALAAMALVPSLSWKTNAQPLNGRWDLTIKTASETYPSWLEVAEGGKVRVVGQVASVHPGEDVKNGGAHLSFTTSEWFGKQMKVVWDVTAAGGNLTGTQKREDGTEGKLSGARAPALNRAVPANWSQAEPLFNGKDLTGWEPIVTGEPGKSPANNWKAENGELVNEAAGANIKTTRKFTDFKLHVEYNCPQDGNSGVYLRGRYEVQVEYEPADRNDKFHGMGSVYGFLPPASDISPRPGQWETYDITLVGRKVSVTRDGVLIIDNREIPGITGGALDSNEGLPGPIYLQGDHTGGMKYRNITIWVPRH
jgi:hypothetical protein